MYNYKEDEFTFGKYAGTKLSELTDTDYLYFVLEDMDLESTHEITEKFAANLETRIQELEGF